jgi:hypothetical protein
MRAHSPQLAAGLASEIKIDQTPYWEDSLQLAAGYSSIVFESGNDKAATSFSRRDQTDQIFSSIRLIKILGI